MWTQYEVEWVFVTKLVGSLPADPELQRKWLEARKPRVRPPDSRSIDEIAEEVAGSMEEREGEDEQERGLSVFQRQEGGLVMRMATVRAHIKDCARVLSSLYVGKVEKEKSFAVKCVNAIYYPPSVYWVPILGRDGERVTAATGVYQKTIRVRTPQGERSAFKNMEYVEGAVMRFPLQVLTQPPSKEHPKGKPVISEADLGKVFEYGGVHGYGGERGDGEGRYEYTLKRV